MMFSNGLIVLTRVFSLVILLSTFCAHLSICQEVLDGADGQSQAVKEEDDAWDMDKFKKEADQTYTLMFHKYNNRIRPPVSFVEIDMALTLAHIRHFDVTRQELKIILDMELNWVDSRLRWIPYKVIEIHESASQVWRPDLVYVNSIAPIDELYPDIVRILHNGSITWIRKEIVTTRCETDPTRSVQSCPIKIGFATNSLDSSDQDRFFFSNKTTASVADGELFTHNWRLVNFEMTLGDENDTRSSTLDLELVLESLQGGDSDEVMQKVSPVNYGRQTTDHRVTDGQRSSSSTQQDCNSGADRMSAYYSLILLVVAVIHCAQLVGSPLIGDRA